MENTNISHSEEGKKQPGNKNKFLPCFISNLFTKKDHVAVIRIQGVIAAGSGLKAGVSLDAISDHLDAAFKLPNLKALALSINSPGGSPVQSELIYKRVKQLSKDNKVPVLCFVEDIAASGGYFIACSGSEIYTAENAIIGSIGVISSGFGFHEIISRIGISRRVYAQGKNKSVLDPFLPEKQEDIALIKSLQKEVHANFINIVKESRQGKLNADDEQLFNGEFWAGKTSVELGLADKIGDLYSVIKEKFGDDVVIKKIGQDKSWIKRKFSIETIIDGLFTKLQEKSLLQKFGL